MSFTLLFAIAALLILIVVVMIVFIKKGWKAALISGCVTFVVLALAFALVIMVIVNSMSGSPA